jgi:hypothetical protein
MVLDPQLLIAALAVLVLALAIDVGCLRWKIKKMLRTKSNANIGESIISLDADLKKLQAFRGELEPFIKDMERRVKRSAQAVGTVRFNAFQGSSLGGNQSFATAFLDEHGNGTLISSLYTRERVSVFSKPLAGFDSEIELTEEEKKAVALAKSKLHAR